MLQQREMTPDEFLQFARLHPDQRFDFIDGEVVEVSPKIVHGRIQTIIATALENYTRHSRVGKVYTEVLHVLDAVKFIPDISVNHPTAADYFTQPPLLAVEIRSDSQSTEAQRRKARDYITHGTQAVWLVFPGEGLEIYRADGSVQALATDDTLEDSTLLPGFTLPLSDIFEDL
ncbi:MAG: Uma2 family endonuclease [Anaerolineae bacterium]|nr:Uma2 family endonuclease [Anaerolineae bacterium]